MPATSQPRDLRLRTYLSHWWQELVSLDGPTRSTLRRLMRCPGELSADHLATEWSASKATAAEATEDEQIESPRIGATRPVHPIRLYLTINVVFFLLAPYLNAPGVSAWTVGSGPVLDGFPFAEASLLPTIESSGFERAPFMVIFDERMQAIQGVLVWVLIPVLALASFAIGFRHRRYLAEHLVLATNLVSFFLVSLIVVCLLMRGVLLFGRTSLTVTLAGLMALFWLLWIAVTTYRSVRAFHGFRSRIGSAIATVWFLLVGKAAMNVYLVALFYVTLFELGDLRFPAAG